MTDLFPQPVEKIVDDYMERLAGRLKGMPESECREFTNEIRSHIYESFTSEPAGDDIERILRVLRRLGDPADVISSRMPERMTRVGKKRIAPLYILAGALIALIGVPLGIGALLTLVGLLAALFALLVAYYATAVSLVVSGFFTAVVSAIAILAPDVIYTINRLANQDVIQLGMFHNNPEVAGIIGLFLSLIISAIGLLMLWSGKHLWHGLRFVVNLIVSSVNGIFRRAMPPRKAASPLTLA